MSEDKSVSNFTSNLEDEDPFLQKKSTEDQSSNVDHRTRSRTQKSMALSFTKLNFFQSRKIKNKFNKLKVENHHYLRKEVSRLSFIDFR
jgi:hypothetical protein